MWNTILHPIWQSIYSMSILSPKRSFSTYLGRAERDLSAPVHLCPRCKPWFQMYGNKTSHHFNSRMLPEDAGKPIKKMGSPSGRKSPEVHHKGVVAATGHPATTQIPAAAWPRKLHEKKKPTNPKHGVFLPVPSCLSWPSPTKKRGHQEYFLRSRLSMMCSAAYPNPTATHPVWCRAAEMPQTGCHGNICFHLLVSCPIRKSER